MADNMTEQELIERFAADFKAHAAQRNKTKRPKRPGHAGSLGDVFLPADVVDDMETAINVAFERVACADAQPFTRR